MIKAFIILVLLCTFVSGLLWGDSETRRAPLYFIGAFAGIFLAVYLVYLVLWWVAFH